MGLIIENLFKTNIVIFITTGIFGWFINYCRKENKKNKEEEGYDLVYTISGLMLTVSFFLFPILGIIKIWL